ncbi:hypothetical protein ABFA07_007024 [Porites harrisoni]
MRDFYFSAIHAYLRTTDEDLAISKDTYLTKKKKAKTLNTLRLSNDGCQVRTSVATSSSQLQYFNLLIMSTVPQQTVRCKR